MSASSAKVSRKENSNHDGADETSGNVNVKEWRLSCTTPFSFVFRHFVVLAVVSCVLLSCNDTCLWMDSCIHIFQDVTLHAQVKCCCAALLTNVAC